MANTIKLRRGTAAQWASANTVLAVGEPGFETDTNKFKIGNGSASWNNLPYTAIDPSTASATYLPLSGSVNWSNINNKPDPVITLQGDVSGSTTLTDLGSASISVTVEKDFTLTFTGDVTGSGSVTNLGSASIALTVAANSVALGTDTTGNYVAGLTAGDGISITGTAGEGWSPTVSINSSTASVTFANITSKPTTLSGYGITDALPASASSNFASLNSPVFSGTPTAPTAASATNNTQIATTAFVQYINRTVPINRRQSSYTLTENDAGALITNGSMAGTCTITIPDLNVPHGTKIDILREHLTGEVEFVPSGVTLYSEGNKRKINATNQAVTLIKTWNATWHLIGALKA